NGYQRYRARGHRLVQVGNRLRQHASQHCRRGTNLLKLEQMNQVAQSAVIAAVGDRPLERRIRALTKHAPRLSTPHFFAIHIGRDMQGLSANLAVRPLQRSQREQTVFTNWKPGNSKERGTTDTAIGRKESEE